MSKLSFNRQDLLNALTITSGAVSHNAQQPIYTHLLFDIKDNVMTVTGSGADLELSVEMQVQSPDVKFTAPAKKFVDVLRAANSEEVKLTIEAGQIKVQLGRGRFVLATLDPEIYPSMPQNKGGQSLQIKPSTLLKLIQSVRFSMAKNDARFYLNGMKFEIENNMMKAIATDGHRLAVNEIDYTDDDCQAIDGKMEFLMPAGNVEKLCNLLKNETMTVILTLSSNALHIDCGEIVMIAKLIDGRFPDYRRVMPKNTLISYSVNREELKGVINRAKVMNNEKIYGLRFDFKESELEISTTNKSTENSSELLDCVRTLGDTDIVIGLNGGYLSEIVNQMTSEEVEINIVDSTSSISIKHETATYIVMPMRL